MINQKIKIGLAASSLLSHITVSSGWYAVTIPSGTVSSDLTDYPVVIYLENMPSTFWGFVTSDGGNIRVYNDSSEQLAFDLIGVDTTLRDGLIVVKSDVAASSNTVIWVYPNPGLTDPLDPTDTYGRNAVWSDYDAVFFNNDLTNRNGSGVDATNDGTSTSEYMKYLGAQSVSGAQGITTDGSHYYNTATNGIYKYDLSWNLLDTNSDPLGDTGLSGVNHCGDPFFYNGELYIPIEKYTNSPYNNQHVCVFDPADLSFKRSYDISANLHEVSSLCFNPDDSTWYMTEFPSTGTSRLHKYTQAFGYIGTLSLTTGIASKQGIDYQNGYFYISSDTDNALWRVKADGSESKVVWVRISTAETEGVVVIDATNILLLQSTTIRKLQKIRKYGMGFPGTGGWTITPVTKRTQWTMGTSVQFNNAAPALNNSFISYGVSSTDSARATIALRSTGQMGMWNSTDSWLMSTGATPVTNQLYRMHQVFNGTTNRKLYRDGALDATDTGVSQRPASTGDYFYVGIDDNDKAEPLFGWMNYAYLRNGLLTDAWIAAEAENVQSPATFYTITELPSAPDGF